MFEYTFTEEMDLSFYYMSWLMERFVQGWSERIRELRESIEEEKPNEVDYIYREVKDQAGRIILKNESPEEATIMIQGVKIRKKIIHSKSEKYNGADVYLEIDDEKFALIQFKKQYNDRYQFIQNQLDNLGKWCDFCVKDDERPSLCPSFIWLIDDRGYHKHRILKLCQVKQILEGKLSASTRKFEKTGIIRSAFKELLVKCWAGAPFNRKPSFQELEYYVKDTNRLLVDFTIGKTRSD